MKTISFSCPEKSFFKGLTIYKPAEHPSMCGSRIIVAWAIMTEWWDGVLEGWFEPFCKEKKNVAHNCLFLVTLEKNGNISQYLCILHQIINWESVPCAYYYVYMKEILSIYCWILLRMLDFDCTKNFFSCCKWIGRLTLADVDVLIIIISENVIFTARLWCLWKCFLLL